MSNGIPKRTDYTGEPLSGPGILWINSKVTAPDTLPVEKFTKWYEEIHIPDIIAAKKGGILASWRYQCMDPERKAPFLAVYSCPDLSFLQSAEFKAIPMTHETLPGGGPIHLFADFDARFYRRVQIYETEKTEPGRAPILISAAIQPGDMQEWDDWYRNEHLEQISQHPGWRRTGRYELVFKKETIGVPEEKKAPKWLTLHEFEEGSLPEGPKLSAPVEQTELAKEVMGKATKVDVAKFRFLRGFGDLNASI